MTTAIADLHHNYSGALVHEAHVGPRHELTLAVELWPPGRPRFCPGEGLPVTVRFGGVRNFDEVSRFFAVERRDGLHYLRFVPRHRQKPGDLAIEVEFDRFGDRVAVLCRNVTVKP